MITKCEKCQCPITVEKMHPCEGLFCSAIFCDACQKSELSRCSLCVQTILCPICLKIWDFCPSCLDESMLYCYEELPPEF